MINFIQQKIQDIKLTIDFVQRENSKRDFIDGRNFNVDPIIKSFIKLTFKKFLEFEYFIDFANLKY